MLYESVGLFVVLIVFFYKFGTREAVRRKQYSKKEMGLLVDSHDTPWVPWARAYGLKGKRLAQRKRRNQRKKEEEISLLPPWTVTKLQGKKAHFEELFTWYLGSRGPVGLV